MPRNLPREFRPLDAVAWGRIERHLHLVEALAWQQFRRCRRTVPLEELIGDAQLALAYAAGLFDEGKGVPFGAYATMVIRHRLVQAVTAWRRGGRLDHVPFTDLAGGCLPGEPLGFDPACPRTREAGQEAATRELLDRVRRTLPPRWFTLLQLYFSEERTLEEIGEQFGVSRERVRQLVAKAIARARLRCVRERAAC
jgi:RNA polymerase sigma factor (sigma-70 family)